MSSFKQPGPEQLFSCFNKDPRQTLHSVKFVPKEGPLRVPAGRYYDSNSQSLIHQRLVNLLNQYKLEGGKSRILKQKLSDSMNSEKRSFTSISTTVNVKGHEIRHRSGSISSSKQNGLSPQLKNLLTKTMSTTQGYSMNSEHFDQDRSRFIRQTMSNQSMLMPRRNYTSFSKRRDDHELRDVESKSEDYKEPAHRSLEAAANTHQRLEESLLTLKDDLMRVDDKLRERLNVRKNKNKQKNGPSKQPRDTYSEDFVCTSRYPHDLGLMPIRRETSPLMQFIEDSKRFQTSKRKTEEGFIPVTQSVTHFLSETAPSRAPNEFNLMDVYRAKPNFSSLQEISPSDHIIQITTKHAADAEGIYYAPRHVI